MPTPSPVHTPGVVDPMVGGRPHIGEMPGSIHEGRKMQFATIEDYAVHQLRVRAALLDPIARRDARRWQLKHLPTTFPNDRGNYRGKRKPKPAPKALTGRERFARLVAQYRGFREAGKCR